MFLTPFNQNKNRQIDYDSTYNTDPTIANVLKAVYKHNMLTSSSAKIASLQYYPEKIKELDWAQQVLMRHQEESNFIKKGLTMPLYGIEDIAMHLASDTFPELVSLGASTAGGAGIGFAGGMLGTMIGGPIGGAAGAFLGSAIGGTSIYNYLSEKMYAHKMSGAGIQVDDVSAFNSIFESVKALPEVAVAAGVMKGGNALIRSKYIQKIMRKSYTGEADSASVNNKADICYKSNTLNAITQGIPDISKKAETIQRPTMFDIDDTQWGFVKNEEGILGFDPNKKIKNQASINKVMLELHNSRIKELPTPLKKAQYILGSTLSSGDYGESLRQIYHQTLLNGLQMLDIDKFIGHKSDKVAQKDLISFLGKWGVTDLSKYGKELSVYADNALKVFDISRARWHNLGFPVGEIEGYVPQKISPYKVSIVPEAEYISDALKSWDFNKMHTNKGKPIITDRQKLKSIKAIRLSFLEQNTLSTISTMEGGSSSPLGRRVIYYNSAESYQESMTKYGELDNIFEVINNHIYSTSQAQGLHTVFGTDPATTLKSLITDLDKLEVSKKGLESAAFTTARQGIQNLYNGLFAFADAGYIGKWWGKPFIMKTYSTINNTSINLMTKNSILYELFETPLNIYFEKMFYEHDPKKTGGLSGFFREVIGDLNTKLSGGFNKNEKEALLSLGQDYSLMLELFPYNISKGGAQDMPIGARKLNHFISKIKRADDMQAYNKERAAKQFQTMWAEEIVNNTSWRELNSEKRGLLKSKGITSKDWEFILNNSEDFIVYGDNLSNIFQTENKSLAELKLKYLSFNKAINAGHKSGYKFAAMQHDYVHSTVVSANTLSSMMFLGTAVSGQDIGSFLARNIFSLRRYALERVARSSSKLDIEGHGLTKEKFFTYLAQRTTLGLLVSSIRWAAAGRLPRIDSLSDWKDLLTDSFVRGDVFPFSVLAELFADYYHTSGMSFGEKTALAALKSSGVGINYAVNRVNDLYQIARSFISGDTEKGFKHMRRLNPLGDWLPTDFMVNRLLLDPLFYSIDSEGAYALFKKEIKNNAKQHFNYYFAPGDFLKHPHKKKLHRGNIAEGDISTVAGMEYEQYLAGLEPKESPLGEKRKKSMAKIAKLQQSMRTKKLNHAGLHIYSLKLDLANKDFALSAAAYYRNSKNKPENMSTNQINRVYKKAREDFINAKNALDRYISRETVQIKDAKVKI